MSLKLLIQQWFALTIKEFRDALNKLWLSAHEPQICIVESHKGMHIYNPTSHCQSASKFMSISIYSNDELERSK